MEIQHQDEDRIIFDKTIDTYEENGIKITTIKKYDCAVSELESLKDVDKQATQMIVDWCLARIEENQNATGYYERLIEKLLTGDKLASK
jgi:hypothetical protein